MVKNNYSVYFTNIAIHDLDDIYRYISEELFAESAATKLLNRIESSIMQLREFPNVTDKLKWTVGHADK